MFRKTAFAVAMAASVLAATAVQAHPKLNSANPAANAVGASPTRIQLVFSEALVAQFSGIDLTMTEMPRMSDVADSAESGKGLGDLASGALDGLGGADEGAVVIIPVVAIFLIGAAILAGAGALAMLFFSWDVLLAVAVELAFSVAAVRVATRVEREGWLTAAVRLTWKPLLGALLCAVLLGATIDHFLPQVDSLPEAVRMLQRG